MKRIDSLYQASVDQEAEKLLKLTVEEVLKIEEYGSIRSIINGKPDSIAFWHWKFEDNLHHVVFITGRRCYLIFHKKYISGIKADNSKILKLTDKEIGMYD